jgi:hypothetical protein
LGATGFYVLLAFGGEIFDGGIFGLPPANCVIDFFIQALAYLLLENLVELLIRQTAMHHGSASGRDGNDASAHSLGLGALALVFVSRRASSRE